MALQYHLYHNLKAKTFFLFILNKDIKLQAATLRYDKQMYTNPYDLHHFSPTLTQILDKQLYEFQYMGVL